MTLATQLQLQIAKMGTMTRHHLLGNDDHPSVEEAGGQGSWSSLSNSAWTMAQMEGTHISSRVR